MVKSAEEKLQQERANLWRAKNLNRQFIGDRSWMPCEAVESVDDWDIFGPKPKPLEQKDGRKRKRECGQDESNHQLNGSDALPNGENGQPHVDSLTPLQNGELVAENGLHDGDTGSREPPNKEGNGSNNATDTEMKGAERSRSANGGESFPQPVGILEGKLQDNLHTTEENGQIKKTDMIDGEDEAEQTSEAASPPPPSRRITRALAATNNSNAATPPVSPTPTLTDSSTSSLYQVDPLFLLPTYVSSILGRTASTSTLATGLPLEEAIETRKLLTVYIQKQEESVRGYENVLAKLIKAKRMRDEVLEMCIAEGHVGEMSDGEDWIDYQRWNLKPGELKKGRDEDDDGGEDREVAGIGGRKGKRRRN
jgi:hypothetical protein